MSIHRDDLKKVNVIFVHSDIDDLGLSIYEFRIYAHIARRAGDGDCFPSIDSIANHCKCSVDTSRETVQRLIAYGLISRQDRPGNSSLYRLTSVKEWNRELVGTLESKSTIRKRAKKQATPTGLGEGSNTPLGLGEGYGIGGGDPSGIRGGDPSGIRGDEVHPLKGIHSKVIQSNPESSFAVEFRNGWSERFERRFGFKYAFAGGKDGSAVKALSRLNMPAEELLEIAKKAWDHPKPFFAGISQTIVGFNSRINELRVAAKSGTIQEARPWDGYVDLNALERVDK